MAKRGSNNTGNVLKGTRGDDLLEVTVRTNEPWKIDAGGGNDTLIGGAGADTLLGGGGNDLIFGSPEDAILDGGRGFDTLDLSQVTQAINFNLFAGDHGELNYWPDATPDLGEGTQVSGFERVIGGSGGDYLTASGDKAMTLVGGGGSDTIQGGSGDDVLVGDYLALASYNPLGLIELPDDGGGDIFLFRFDSSGGNDRILDFEFGADYLFFWGNPQPNLADIYTDEADLVIPWENGTVTLVGLGQLDPSQYADLFTLASGGAGV